MCPKYLIWGEWLTDIVEKEDYIEAFLIWYSGIKLVRNSFKLQTLLVFVPVTLLDTANKENVIRI